MVETVIMLLIQLCVLVGLVYLVLFVLGRLGISIPDKIVQILWVVVVLIALLLLYRALGPALNLRF